MPRLHPTRRASSDAAADRKGDSFRDLTGLNQNQLNALATFQKTLDTAQAFGKEAAELAKAAGAMKLVEDGKKAGIVKNEDANKKTNAILDDLQKDPNANRLKQGIELLDQSEERRRRFRRPMQTPPRTAC